MRIAPIQKLLCIAAFGLIAVCLGRAQNPPAGSEETPAATRSIEDLNLVGADAVMPPFSESVIDLQSGFRRALFSKGMALRVIQQLQYAQNTLDAPVAADSQTYVGQREFTGAMEHLIFTADLRQLGLRHAQFYGSGVWNWVSWNPAGPKTFQLWGLYLFKSLGAGRAEVKAGYISNNMEFAGLFVGGSTASGAQGVYAVLPYELGMSYFPLTAPSVNLRLRGPRNIYVKAAAQRSLDAAGGPATVRRNRTGFRFAPQGDKLFTVEEVGYTRSASAAAHQIWFRAGYMRNSTPYLNFRNGKMESGNDSAYLLADLQVRQPDKLQPAHGLYLGGSAMTAASRFTPYDRYYEARAYQMAPFVSRPADMISLVSTYTGHSRYLTDALAAAGKSLWRNSASVTGSYSLHLRRGQFVSLGLSYIHGPAITPRAHDALNFATSYTVFF
jgi:porin